MRFGFILILGVVVCSSCITNKKITYVQKDDLHEELPLDSIVRSYQLQEYEYRIQPEDILSIQIESLSEREYDFLSSARNRAGGGNMQNPSLFGFLVDEQGMIEFIEEGRIQVAGLTIFEIQDQLQRIAAKYLEKPVVRVRLLNFRFTVLGEVNGEGVQNTLNNRITILEAIGLAGGLSELADRSQVKLIRQKGATTEVSYVNLLDENLMLSPYYYMHQNDILVVPPLKQRPFRRYFGQNLSLFVSTISTVLLIVTLITTN